MSKLGIAAGTANPKENSERTMDKLANPKKTREIIQKYHFSIQKKYGQNFLIDARVPEKIVRGAGVSGDDFVLEIGPGIGTLTQYLAEAAREVCAVEIDRKLLPILEETLAPYDNVTVINADILKMDLCALAAEKNDGRPIKVVANLPYYITTPIVMSLLENHVPFINLTVMVQREVAARMQAKPGSKDYGALSLAIRYYAEPYIVANVPSHCFMPRPDVDSTVIRLTRRAEPPVRTADERQMFRVIRAAFGQRRKTLANALANSPEQSWDKPRVRQALEAAGLPDAVRGEALTLEQFAALSDLLL